MKWRVDFSKDAIKFLRRNNLEENFIIDKIKLVLRKFRGEQMNVDIKKLTGEWQGFYRIRVGKLRIIAEFQFEYRRVYIEQVDWRDSAYK